MTRRERLYRSAERLLKFLDLNAPDQFVAHECVTLLGHCFRCFGPETGRAYDQWLTRLIRVSAHQCLGCGVDLPDDQATRFCPTCLDPAGLPDLVKDLFRDDDVSIRAPGQ